jgi:hypothetical protein
MKARKRALEEDDALRKATQRQSENERVLKGEKRMRIELLFNERMKPKKKAFNREKRWPIR